MKVSYLWLRDYIKLSESPSLLADRLTSSGAEVEHFSPPDFLLHAGLLLGTLESASRLSSAPDLLELSISIGRRQSIKVVQRGTASRRGQRVVVATQGVHLPSMQAPIEARRFGSITSEGILCSAEILGLGREQKYLRVKTDHLDGAPFSDCTSLLEDASVFEISLTPNRGDLAAHYGIARELGVLLSREVRYPVAPLLRSAPSHETEAKIRISSTEDCPRYLGLRLSGILVAPSPPWLQHRLRSIGLSSVNNVVDITNFVMHSVGQPLHAFDAAQINGAIEVRRANKSIDFEALDHKKYALKADDLLICDDHRPLALAGIIGGAYSAVSDQTKELFLEAAYFAPKLIAQTARRIDLQTDASFRYARGIDPEKVFEALCWAADLLRIYASAHISEPVHDYYPKALPERLIECRLDRLNQLSGVDIPRPKVRRILAALDIQIKTEEKNKLTLSTPYYRSDVLREVDVFEEILRIYGYDQLDRPMCISYRPKRHLSSKGLLIERTASELLVSKGFLEIITNALLNIPPDTEYRSICAEPPEQWAYVQEQSTTHPRFLRPSLFPSGIEVINYNLNRKQTHLYFFEIGRAYWRKKANTYGESKRLAIYICPEARTNDWRPEAPHDFYELSSVLCQLFQKIGLQKVLSRSTSSPWFKEGLDWSYGPQLLASGGLLHAHYISTPTYAAEVHLSQIEDVLHRVAPLRYKQIAQSPEVTRDLSLIIDKQLPYARVEEIIDELGLELLRTTHLISVYEGASLPPNKKSYALSFTLQGPKTLSEAQITSTMKALMLSFEKQLSATIRQS